MNGSILEWEGCRVYPGGATPYAVDAIPLRAAQHFGGDPENGLVITLVDFWVMEPLSLSRLNVLAWVPVDHDPVPPDVVKVLDRSQATVVAMSRFGQSALEQRGFRSMYAPHGIDCDTFAPGDRAQARGELGLPTDAFVVGMVAANKGYPPRKGFPEAIAAFAGFQREHQDAILVMHTEPQGVIQGVNLPAILSHYGVPEQAVRLSGANDWTMAEPVDQIARLYNAFDVLLAPSYGEGFGIPIVEAQACGTPVIVTAHTAMTELCGAGWLVGGQEFWSLQGAMWRVPNIDRILWALNEAYKMSGRMRDRAREFALDYEYRKVFAEAWEPILAEVADRVTVAA